MAKNYYSIDRSKLSKYKGYYQRVHASLMESKDYLKEYDVFISHSYKDRDMVERVKEHLETEYGVKCYVDWKESERNPYKAADELKKVMDKCKVMLLLRTENSDKSFWIPWETGCFETKKDSQGHSGVEDIIIFAISDESKGVTQATVMNKTFEHMEFLKRYADGGEGNLDTFLKNRKLGKYSL